MTKILTIGHRGAKGYAPENTLDSFRKAIGMGCDGIEFDVHLSADNVVMVIHDETVNRTTRGKGLVKDLTSSQLKTLGVPALPEVLEAIGKNCLINIELKTGTAAKPVMELIGKYISQNNWDYDSFLVSSFDWNSLKEIREWNPKIPLGVLTETDLPLAIAFSEFIKSETIHPYFHLLTAENTRQMQEKGLKVFPWTVNEPEDIARIKSYQINGIITDFPDRI